MADAGGRSEPAGSVAWQARWRPHALQRGERLWRPLQAWRAVHPLASALALALGSLLAGLLVWSLLGPAMAGGAFGQGVALLLGQLRLGQDFLSLAAMVQRADLPLAQLVGSFGARLLVALLALALFNAVLHRLSVGPFRARFGRESTLTTRLLRQLVSLLLLPVVVLACLSSLKSLLDLLASAQPLPNWLAAVVWLLPYLPALLLFVALIWLTLPNRLLGSNSLLGALLGWMAYVLWSVVIMASLGSRAAAGDATQAGSAIGAIAADPQVLRLLFGLTGFWLCFMLAVWISYIAHPAMRGDYEARDCRLPLGSQLSAALAMLQRLDAAQTSDGHHDWLDQAALLRGLPGDRRALRAVADRLQAAGYIAQRPFPAAAQLQMNPAEGSIGDFLASFGSDWSTTANSRGMNAVRRLLDPALERPLSDLLQAEGLRGAKADNFFLAGLGRSGAQSRPSGAGSGSMLSAYEAAQRASEELAQLLDQSWRSRWQQLAEHQTSLQAASAPVEMPVPVQHRARLEAAPGVPGWNPQKGGREPQTASEAAPISSSGKNNPASVSPRPQPSSLADIRRAVEAARQRR